MPRDVEIPKGASIQQAAHRLVAAGLLPDETRFVLMARVSGRAHQIKAGNYRVKTPMTPWALLIMLTEGDTTSPVLNITLIEGWNWRQIRQQLADESGLKHDASTLSDAELAQALELPGSSVEGWLFPDTYQVNRGSSELALLRRARDTMEKRLQKAWQARAENLPLKTPYEALTLASIVEKETGAPADRHMVAAVFVNRLKKGMRLQTDPTVIYGLGDDFDGNLRRRDLETDTPYNSYTRAGLPPTPIAMPGLASINAVLHPADSDALYFVARGDGTSQFSSSLEDHNAAVNRYQLRRRNP